MTNTDDKLPQKIDISTDSSVLDTIWQNYLSWYPRYDEMSQGRTDFQIEKFIALDDGTLCHSYVHTLYQTRVMRGELLREVREGIELARTFDYKWNKQTDKTQPIKWDVNGPNGGSSKLCWYDIDKMEYQHRICEIGMSIKDKLQQLDLFDRILNKMVEINGKEFSRDQYQQEASDYWSIRFQKQIADDILQAKTGINSGNVKSLRLAMADTIVKDSPNKVEHFPEVFKKMFSGDPSQVAELLNEMHQNISQKLDVMAGKSQPELPNADALKTIGIKIGDIT